MPYGDDDEGDGTASMRSALRREPWTRNGPSRLVKVVPASGTKRSEVSGYVCQESSLLGRTPEVIERSLGLPEKFLSGGCDVYRLLRLPMSCEVAYELTTAFPDGLAFTFMSDPRYPPGSATVHQWRLLVPVPAVHLITVMPSSRYPYLHR